jgi:peptidoglycan/LPS O-acetylase OafA/YrhL
LKQYFPSLTGFRAVAAWIVFAHHYNPFSRDRFISDVIDEGYIGVTLFFVLSGFLITIRYDDRSSRETYGQYIRNRFARIYPLFFILTTLTFLVGIEWNTIKYLASITFIQGFIPDWQFTGIPQSWSLTVEETFYFLAPFLFVIIRKEKLAWLLPVIFLAIGVVAYFNSIHFMLVYTFFGRSFDFFAGIVVAKLYQRGFRYKHLTHIGAGGIMLCVLAMTLVKGNETYAILTAPGLLIHNLLLPATTAVLLLGLATEITWIQRVLSASPMQLLGKSSYSFYLIHVGFIASLLPGNVVIVFVLLNGIAVMIYYLVERPLQVFVSHGNHGTSSLS